MNSIFVAVAVSIARLLLPGINQYNAEITRWVSEKTGYEIEILREEKPFEEYDEDIELIDLKEELGEEIYNLLINNRYDTAIEVLTAGAVKLKEIEGLSEEKANEIIEIIKSQFEDEE